MIARLPHLLCVLGAVAALAAAGCGDDDEPEGRKLPQNVSDVLLPQLESVGDRVAAGVSGACDDIYSDDPEVGNIGAIDSALESIPSDVDPEIRSALEQSIERLKQLVDEECARIRAAEGPDETVPDETTETVTTETETVPADTTETNTTPTTPTTPTDPTTPPESNGNGPDGNGPPGLDRGGAEAPDEDGD